MRTPVVSVGAPGVTTASVTESIAALAVSDPAYRRTLNAAPITISLSALTTLQGKEIYFEQGNWGRVTFTLPAGSEWKLPERALPILSGLGAVVQIVQTNAGRWRIDEITPGALLRTDAHGYHPVQEAGLKFWGEVDYGIQQTRIGQPNTASVTAWKCRGGCPDDLYHSGADPNSTAHQVVVDSNFPGGYASRQRTSAGLTGFLKSTYVPASKQYVIVAVMRPTAGGTTGTLFRTKSDGTEGGTYLNTLYWLQPLPAGTNTLASLDVLGEKEALGNATFSAGVGTFTSQQDGHLAINDFIIYANGARWVTSRTSATSYSISDTGFTDATPKPFVRKPTFERLVPRVIVWAASQETGTATAGGATTLTNSEKLWITNVWATCQVAITAGTGAGQTRTVASNTATVLTVSVAWDTNPDATSVYRIEAVETYASNCNGVTRMQTPASLVNMPIPSELTFTGGWALNLGAILLFDGAISNLPGLLRWLAERYPFTIIR